MLQRLRNKRAEGEQGFTLIELLVVVLIIAILAAIAVPVFLNQRKKAWVSQVESALKDAATAQESYRTDHTTYATTVAALQDEGFNFSDEDVSMADADIDANADGYCMAVHSDHDESIDGYYDSAEGQPVVEDDGTVTGIGECPTTYP